MRLMCPEIIRASVTRLRAFNAAIFTRQEDEDFLARTRVFHWLCFFAI